MAANSFLVRGRNSSPLRRVISTAFVCVVVLITVNLNVFDRYPSQGVINALISMEHLMNFVGAAQAITNLFVVSVGFLLTAFEANYMVLALLKSYSTVIGGPNDGGTTLKMGRLIGVLERIILYILIITGNPTQHDRIHHRGQCVGPVQGARRQEFRRVLPGRHARVSWGRPGSQPLDKSDYGVTDNH